MFSSVKSFSLGSYGSLFSIFRISPLKIFAAWKTWYAALQLSAFEYTNGYSSSVMLYEANTPASIICPVGTSFAYMISVSLLHDGCQNLNLFSNDFDEFLFHFFYPVCSGIYSITFQILYILIFYICHFQNNKILYNSFLDKSNFLLQACALAFLEILLSVKALPRYYHLILACSLLYMLTLTEFVVLYFLDN